MPAEKQPRRLGRGLEALFGSTEKEEQPAQSESALRDIPVSRISPNPFQPRHNFDPGELRELEASLAATGLLQPITVRATDSVDRYELVAGERRLRAATNLGWKEIPAIVKTLDDNEMLSVALVENLQRADLNPIEEAEGYQVLISRFGYTPQQVSGMVGKDRSTVANTLRILQLPSDVRALLRSGNLTAGQARPLLGLQDEEQIIALAREISETGLSAREVERRIREVPAPERKPAKGKRGARSVVASAELRSIEQDLRRLLQTDVVLTLKTATTGAITVSFYSADDLERLTELMGLHRNPH